MAKVLCNYSGLTLEISHVPMYLKQGYIHPIFHLTTDGLLDLYSEYGRGNLNNTDIYLLYLALLHSTGQIEWSAHAVITKYTPKLIANNIDKLVAVIWKTNSICDFTFRQPSYAINSDTANLETTPGWIAAWKNNIEEWKASISTHDYLVALTKAEHTVQYAINSLHAVDSSRIGQDKLAAALARWAHLAATFPEAKVERWQRIIRTCYNSERMFYTPKAEIKEIKEYCYDNIEAGTVHFHLLIETLDKGIQNHNSYLDLPALEDEPGYTLLPPGTSEEQATLEAIRNTAPTKEPIEAEYTSKLAYIKAKLAYATAKKRSGGNK